jgi:hypothetical protein
LVHTDADEEIERLTRSAFDAAGVDLTQIDWMLSLTPFERLQVLYETTLSLARLMPPDADAD